MCAKSKEYVAGPHVNTTFSHVWKKTYRPDPIYLHVGSGCGHALKRREIHRSGMVGDWSLLVRGCLLVVRPNKGRFR